MFYQNVEAAPISIAPRCSLPTVEAGEADRISKQTHSGLDPNVVQNSLLQPRNQEVGTLSRGLSRIPIDMDA